MKFVSTELPGVLLVEPQVFRDSRGYFLEIFHARRYRDEPGLLEFVQDNVSLSECNVLRGLHYQLGSPQGKLITVLAGEIFDVAVDIRKGSPTFGRWVGETLSAHNARQLYIPKGFAHGFCVTSETAIVLYKCTDFYDPKEERGIIWNDPILRIKWPTSDPILSDKDKAYSTVEKISTDQFPVF